MNEQPVKELQKYLHKGVLHEVKELPKGEYHKYPDEEFYEMMKSHDEGETLKTFLIVYKSRARDGKTNS